MNLQNIVHEIEKVDPEFHERISPRRKAIKNMFGFGGKVALSALPFAIGGLFKKAYGQSSGSVEDVLNFALTLEYLEAEFYTRGVQAHSVPLAGSPALGALTKIRNDENHHVTFLKSALGANAVAKPNFDYTAGGAFPDPFNPLNYDVFLAIAQAFEDTGVRAYKGQAPNLLGNRTVLTAALNIHSVEARHASHIRQMRRARSGAPTDLQPWITLNNRGGLPAATQAVYNGEELTTQAGVNIAGISAGGITISAASASEAFDEPLTRAEVLAIVQPFIM